jgi:tRNA (cmo5U34)-methyltransferase
MTIDATAAQFFGRMVDDYDSLIRRAVPRYDEMTDLLVAHLPPGPTRILELGCGTGNLTLRLIEKYPGAEVVTVDAAAEMTRITMSRIASKHPETTRVRAVTARFEDVAFAPEEFDLVTSCMSLHHVRDKAPLYARMSSWLRPRGTIAFADQLLGATDAIQREHWDRWLAHCRQPGHCTPAEVQSLLDHAAAHDHYVPLPEHFRLMSEAGFRSMDCVWRYGMYSVVVGEK